MQGLRDNYFKHLQSSSKLEAPFSLSGITKVPALLRQAMQSNHNSLYIVIGTRATSKPCILDLVLFRSISVALLPAAWLELKLKPEVTLKAEVMFSARACTEAPICPAGPGPWLPASAVLAASAKLVSK